MKDIRYIFCDLDGTLLNNAKEPTRKTITYLHELKKKSDIQIGIATGRAPSSVLPMMKKYDMESVIDVVVANNGVHTLITDKEKTSVQGMVETEQIKQILDAFSTLPYISVCFHNSDILYASEVNARVSSILRMNQMQFVFNPCKHDDYQITPRVMLLFEPVFRPLVEEVVKHCPIEGLKGYFAESDIYEFTNKDISKHKAIQSYVEQRGDTLANVMVFGDSENDIGMLKACGIGVVMKNAVEDIKQYGDIVSEYTNEEDGIYKFLIKHEKLIAEKGENL